MTIVRYEPWSLMHRFLGDGPGAANWAPSVDVREDADRFTVQADLPGVDAKDIQIETDNGTLTIRGQRSIQKQAARTGFERLERVEGSFLRRFLLPDNVNAEQIKARHTNGVLEVTIPKQPQPEPRRVSVEVN